MKKGNLLLLSTAAMMMLVACGENKTPTSSIEDNSSQEGVPSASGASASLPVGESSSPIPSSSSSDNGGGSGRISSQEAMNRALAADYSNMTAYSYAISNDVGGAGEYEFYVNDYQIVYSNDTGSEIVQYFHDYNGESYQFFEAKNEGEVDAWLNKGYNGAAVGLGNMNSLDVRELLAAIKKYKDKVQYQQGVFYIVNEEAVEEIVRESYMWCWDVSIDTIFFTIDSESLTFTKIGGFDRDLDTDYNLAVAQIYQVGTTSWSQSLPTAPNADNVKEYWQFKGWSGPQVQVYPASLTMSVDENAIKDGDSYVLEIEEGIPFDVSAIWDVPQGVEGARQVRHNSINYVSTNENVAFVGYNNSYSRLIVGKAAGDAEIYAVSEAPQGGTPVESNHIKVHVKALAEQNLEGAVYNLSFDGTIVNGNVAATNSINNTKPFDVTVNEGVSVLTGTETSANFNGSNVLVLRSSQQETLNTEFAGDAVATFDFSDQQVSGVSFYYGALFSNYYVGASYLTKVAIETSNDGTTWVEAADITEEVKEHNSFENLHLIEKSFAPASKVRIHLYSSMIGTAYEMSIKNIAFIADSNCNEHFDAPTNPVTSVTIAAANNATKVKMGNTLQINGSVAPNNASNKTLVWHVSDESVAMISSNGVLTPVAPGKVTVYATSAYGATSELVKSNEITITVAAQDAVPEELIGTWKEGEYQPNYFEVSSSSVTIKLYGENDVSLQYVGNDEDGYSVFGSFTDKNTPGYLKIKPSSSHSNESDFSYNLEVGGKSYKSNVYTHNEVLTKYVKATGMSLSVSKSTIKAGDSAYISASFAPNGATSEAYKIEVSDTSIICFLDDEGEETTRTDLDAASKSFKAKTAGQVTVTATSESGLTATLLITVSETTKVSQITVTLGNNEIAVGGNTQAKATVAPSNADNKEVTWTSSDETVATVSASGKVTGKKAGNCEIIATAKDGSGVTGRASISVSADGPVLSLPSDVVGKSYCVTEDGYYQDIIFEFISATEVRVHSAEDSFLGFDDTYTLKRVESGVYRLEDSRTYFLEITFGNNGEIIVTMEQGVDDDGMISIEDKDISEGLIG